MAYESTWWSVLFLFSLRTGGQVFFFFNLFSLYFYCNFRLTGTNVCAFFTSIAASLLTSSFAGSVCSSSRKQVYGTSFMPLTEHQSHKCLSMFYMSLCVCECVHACMHMCAVVPVWTSENNFWEVVLSFPHAGFLRDWTQIARFLGSKHLSLLNHFASSPQAPAPNSHHVFLVFRIKINSYINTKW